MGKLAVSPRLPFLPLKHVVVTKSRCVLQEKSTHFRQVFVVKIYGRPSFQHATLLIYVISCCRVHSCITRVCYAFCLKHTGVPVLKTFAPRYANFKRKASLYIHVTAEIPLNITTNSTSAVFPHFLKKGCLRGYLAPTRWVRAYGDDP